MDDMDGWTVGRIVRTMLPLLVLLSILEIGSGLVLDRLQRSFLSNPALLVLVPAMIGMGGNLGSVLAARLSTGLHLGTIDPDDWRPDETVVSSGLAILGIGLTEGMVLAAMTWGAGRFIGGTLAPTALVQITVVSAMLLSLLVIVVSYTTTMLSYRMGYDPDDTAIPIVTNVSDICGVLILSGVILVVL